MLKLEGESGRAVIEVNFYLTVSVLKMLKILYWLQNKHFGYIILCRIVENQQIICQAHSDSRQGDRHYLKQQQQITTKLSG